MKGLILLSLLLVLYANDLPVEKYYNLLFTSSIKNTNVFSEKSIRKDNTDSQEKETPDLKVLSGNITDDEAVLFINHVCLAMGHFPLSKTVSENGMAGWYYYVDSDYANPDEFKKYFLQFMNEETFDYLFQIYGYQIYNNFVVRDTELELSRYEVDSSGERECYIINRTENELQIKVPFSYCGLLDVEPKDDYGEVWLKKQVQGEWKIVKMSQWLNDLTCYEFKEYAGMFLIKNESDYVEFLKKYGQDCTGNRISTQIIRNGEYICAESDKRLLTRSDLESLTKLSAILAYYEIEARHGCVSEWEDSLISLDLYFSYYCPWFCEGGGNPKELNDIEKKNQEILQEYIKSF